MTIRTGDCIEVMRGMEAESFDAIVTDPPYGLEFMGKRWDAFKSPGRGARVRKERASEMTPSGKGHTTSKGPFLASGVDQYVAGHPFQAWCEQWGREALRVTKPGGYLLAFGGTRTHHRLVCGLEDAGWIIRDELDWIYACLSDDTELLTREHGWVRYNRASEGDHAAAFDPETGELRWERIRKVHAYDHVGPMVEVGPSLVTLNHRVVIDTATARVPHLPRVWEELSARLGVGQESHVASMLASVQWQAEDSRPPLSSGQGVESGTTATLVGVDEGPVQSGLEGRRYRVQEARELLWGPIRASTGVGAPDGPPRRVRDGAPSPASRVVRLLAHALGVRQSREPRPDRQPPREPDAVAGQPDAQTLRARQGYRGDGLSPGIPPRLVDYAGVVWCITVPSGAFVARRNGVAFVTGNSGFPKGKANLKPAHEPIVLARKPGPLRPLAIDECRIEGAPDLRGRDAPGNVPNGNGQTHGAMDRAPYQVPAGRWPSNVLLSDPELFDEPNPYVVGSGATTTDGVAVRQKGGAGAVHGIYGKGMGAYPPGSEDVTFGGSGGYSRFFIVPKADRADREPVLRGQLPEQVIETQGKAEGWTWDENGGHSTGDNRKPRANQHPTVKPTDLMRHLVRLVTPQGGTVLDPFLGSGSTAIACELEGFPWVGIEKEPEYVAIAEARLNGTQRGLGLEVSA